MMPQTSDIARLDQIDAGDQLVTVVAGQGAVRVQVSKKNTGSGTNSVLTVQIGPAQALALARLLAVTAGAAVQPQLALFGECSEVRRRQFSVADLAEMRRLRASGVLLREIAERFSCAISTVARQTAGIRPETVEGGALLFHQMPLPLRPRLVRSRS